MKRILKRALGLLAAAALLLPAACGKTAAGSPYITDTKFLLNTTCTISLYDKQDRAVLDRTFQLCARYDRLFSMNDSRSDVYKINHAKGKAVRVDPETAAVIRHGLGYSKESGGLFDITVGALTSLWNIEGEHPTVPPEDRIRAAMKTIDYRNVVVSGNTVTLKNPDARIDLGGVAKGFIADRLKAFLLSNGVHRGIVNLGGNVVVLGSKAENTPWIVGVQQPFQGKNEDVGYLYVTDKSVVTSGIYERYFVQNGKLYAHILDPRTGYPVENNLSSVTIVSDESKQGDGLSATCFLLGVEKATRLVESLHNVEAIFITKDGKVVTTPGINKTVRFVPAAQAGKESQPAAAS